jgi:hypothetical protein
MTETLSKMSENRDDNRKLLKQKKSLIIKQISAAKSQKLSIWTSVCISEHGSQIVSMMDLEVEIL